MLILFRQTHPYFLMRAYDKAPLIKMMRYILDDSPWDVWMFAGDGYNIMAVDTQLLYYQNTSSCN